MNAMLSEALQEFIGLLGQLMKNLLGQDAKTWGDEFKKFLRKEPCWVVNKAVSTPSILGFISTIVIPATTSRFVAREKFVLDTSRKAKVKISYLGDNFTEWFLSGNGKTEDPITEQTLRYHNLRQSSADDSVIAELGGAKNSETTLSEMFSLMKKQGKGEDGVLLSNGRANIFYIRDQNEVLRAVGVRWGGLGWGVGASSVEGRHWWGGGSQVFSRNAESLTV